VQHSESTGSTLGAAGDHQAGELFDHRKCSRWDRNAAAGMLLDAMWGQTASVAAEPRKAALAAVPWLAVMGRCLLLLAALLPEVRTLPQQGAVLLLARAVEGIGMTLQDLLCDDGPAGLTAQLTAAGFSSWEAVPAQLQLLEHAVTALVIPGGSRPSHAQVSTAAELMTTLGLSLNSLAFPTACNNPHCSNLSGASELMLVSGRSKMCAGCLVARYCSRDCQRQHWKQHKPHTHTARHLLLQLPRLPMQTELQTQEQRQRQL